VFHTEFEGTFLVHPRTKFHVASSALY